MKYASSMRYAGMLVDAQEADYTSYKKLGLLCPICHAPVFLVSSSERESHTRLVTNKTTGIKKEVQVAASFAEKHFSHFQDVSEEQVDQCELRIRNLTPTEVHRYSRGAHNQRERFFRSHFWRLLEMSYKMETWEEDAAFAKSGFLSNCPAKDPDNYRQLKWVKFSDRFVSAFKSKREFMVSVAKAAIDDISSMDVEGLEEVGFRPEVIAYLKQWQQAIDGRMQLEITQEAIDFLGHKRNRDMVEHLFAKALADYALNGQDEVLPLDLMAPCAIDQEFLAAHISHYTKNFEAIHSWNPKKLDSALHWIFACVATILATTPWADGFEKLEEKADSLSLRTHLITSSKGVWHYTVNTGNTHFQPFSKVTGRPFADAPDWISGIKNGGSVTRVLPQKDYSLKITIDPTVPGAALFDIGKGKEPSAPGNLMITAAVAWKQEGEEALMEMLPIMYESISEACASAGYPAAKLVKPKKLPWLAIFLMPNPAIGLCPWLANAEYAIAHFLIQLDAQ
jgi:hypothetical protein